MKLLLDAGNSRLKWAALGRNGIAERGVVSYGAEATTAAGDRLARDWSALPTPNRIVLCSVAPAATTRSVIQWCRRHGSCPIQIVRSQAIAHGVTNAYTRPETLGDDRWAALIGAHRRYHGNKCIVDAGTAVTIDLIHANGHHRGGLIAPGYQSMLQALQSSTELDIPSQADRPLAMSPGDNTADCIRAGALYSLVGLIDQAVRQFIAGDNRLILTGGNAPMLQPLLQPTLPQGAIHDPDLVFSGLAVIAESPQ